MLKKYAIRVILGGSARTYIVQDIGSVDAICTALDLLELDLPGVTRASVISIIAKAYPEGRHLADEGEGPVLDTTHGLHAIPDLEQEAA